MITNQNGLRSVLLPSLNTSLLAYSRSWKGTGHLDVLWWKLQCWLRVQTYWTWETFHYTFLFPIVWKRIWCLCTDPPTGAHWNERKRRSAWKPFSKGPLLYQYWQQKRKLSIRWRRWQHVPVQMTVMMLCYDIFFECFSVDGESATKTVAGLQQQQLTNDLFWQSYKTREK